MAKTRDYMDYLDESIGIAPAHSQEEYQASEVISQIMKEHGLETTVEEFDSAGTGVMARNVLAIVLFVTLLVAGLVPDTLHIVMLLVALASAGLLTFMRFVRNIFENIGPARRSQNVVGVRRARNQNSGRTSRPIVIVAHYDTPREEPMRKGGLARYQSMLVRAGVFCPAIVCVTVLFQLLGFLPEGFRMFMWVVGLIACLPAVVLAVTSLMGRFGNCTVGANNNKSSIAAMLTLVDKISPAEDRATDAARSRPRPRREVRLQETPEVESTQQNNQVVEEVKGVRHGEEVLRSLGILPASCEITYEQPRVVVEDEQIEVAKNPYDEVSDVMEPEADEQYDDYEDYDEDSYDSDYDDEYDEEYDDDYEDDYEEDYADEYDDIESDEEDEAEEDEAPKPERRVIRLTEDESDDEELTDDYDELDEYDEEYDDEYDEYEEEEDEEFEDDQDGTPIGSSIGAWFSERIDNLRSRFGSKDEDDSDGWIDEDEEYEYEDEDVEEESFEDEEEDYDSEDNDDQDEEEYEEEYEDEYDDEYDDEYEDEDYSVDEEESSDGEDDSEEEFDYDDPDASFDEDEEYDYDELDDQESDDEEASWEEYEDQEEDPDAVADLAHDAEDEEDYESDFEYDDDELYPSSSFEPIELPDDEEFEEEDEVDPNPPKRRPLFGRLLRRKSVPEPEEVDYEEEDEVYEDQYDEAEDYEEEASDFEDDADSDDAAVEDSDDDVVDADSDDYSDEEYYDDEVYEEEFDDEEFDEEEYYDEEDYEENPEEELEEDEPAQKRPSLGQRILGLFRGKKTEDSHVEDFDEDSDEYYLEEEEYDEEYDGEYYDDDDYEEEDISEDNQDSSIEEDSLVADYADDYDEYDDQLSTYDDEEPMDDEYVDEDDAVEPATPIATPAPVRPPDPNMLHFDREEDDDIPERDDSGINTITDNYDLLDGDIPRESQRERPAAIDDPTWGTSTYQPTRPSYNIARRAALYDLPDPSGATVDPLADEYEYTEDVPATQDEAQRTGGRVGFWGDDDSAQSSSWKGGATLRDDLRGDPYESSEDDLKDAMLDMGDEFLDEHDVWFVATGASEAEHGGMKAFLDAHRRDIRGAFLINLECVGAGTLSVYVREGLTTRRRADRRLVRLISDVARDLHIKVDTAMCDWTETDAATAMKARVRAATIVGLDDSDLPALSHTVDDVPENVSPKQAYDVVRIITEVIRRS